MALTELIFGEKKKVSMGAGVPFGPGILEFDAAIEEVYQDAAEITDHPIEEGSDISDHIRKLPAQYEITGRITNTPVVFLASLSALSPVKLTEKSPNLPTQSDRVSDSYDLLQQIMNEGVVIDVSTSLRDYSNMAITSLVVRRNAETGQVLDCTVNLREILKAKALSIDVPVPSNVGNNNAQNQGKKSGSTASEAQTDTGSSILNDLGSAIGGFFGG
jgi:hypothetical protein